MWTEAARRSEEARASVQGPAPGWPTFDDPEPDPDEPTTPVAPLFAVRDGVLRDAAVAGLGTAIMIVCALLALPLPTASALAQGAGALVVIALIGRATFADLGRRSAVDPQPWPAGIGAAPFDAQERARHAFGALALCAYGGLMIATSSSEHRLDMAWFFAGLGLGATAGLLLAWRQVIKIERRLGVELYRERTAGRSRAARRRALKTVYAGPPPN